MKHLLLSLLLLFSFSNLQAQFQQGGWGGKEAKIKGKITGVLQDYDTKESIPYATIVLKKDGKEIDGTITDEDGKFKFVDIEIDNYMIIFSYIGYKDIALPDVIMTKEKPDVNLKEIFLKPDNILLDAVEVVEEKALIENKADRIVYNADKDVTSAGGDAADVLRKVPLLSVDLEGNVSLRGSTNIRILINGKPSNMFSNSVADALKMFPADQIKSVEVITTPSAKYDAEGSGGIINIITKKKQIDGYSGNLSLGGGTRQNRANAGLNAAKGRFGVNGSGSGFYTIPQIGLSDFYREDLIGSQKRTMEQVGETKTSRIGYWGSAGAFYDFNAYNAINSSISFNGFSMDTDGFVDVSFIDPIISITELYRRNTIMDSRNDGFDWTTDYTKTFDDKNREFSISYQLNGNNNNSNTNLDQIGDLTDSLNINERSFNDGDNLQSTFQTDYSHPITEKIKLEVGAKAILRDILSDYTYETFNSEKSVFEIDNVRTNKFKYDQNVYAGYASMNFTVGEGNSLIIGARYEKTDIKGNFENGESEVSTGYQNLLPNIMFSKKLENFSNLRFAYNQRIQRPSLYFLNPFRQDADRRNVTFGNPELKPELTHQWEVSYNTFVKGTAIYASLFYKWTQGIIEQYTSVLDNGISETTYNNIGNNNAIGLNFFGSTTIKEKLTLRGGLNFNTYNTNSTIEGLDLSNTGVQFGGNVMATWSLPKDWKIEGFAFGRSRQLTIQGTIPTFSMMSFGIKKDLFNKRGSIGMNVIEPFVKYKDFGSELTGENFYQTSLFQMPFRSIGINFSYTFGKLDFKARQSKIKNDDMKQGDDGGGNQRGF